MDALSFSKSNLALRRRFMTPSWSRQNRKPFYGQPPPPFKPLLNVLSLTVFSTMKFNQSDTLKLWVGVEVIEATGLWPFNLEIKAIEALEVV